MLWKYFTQYVSKFGKLSSGHRTGKDQFSFQFQRRAMLKNVQTTVQLHWLHKLLKLCSKSFQVISAVHEWRNFQMYKLGLERQRNQRSNCQHLLDHRESKGVTEKYLFLLHWLHKSLLLCGAKQTVENSERDGNTRPPDLPLEKFVCRSGSNS